MLHRLPSALGILSALALAAMTLVLSARPLATADNWYYLKMGELYSAEGPWAQSEPMLFTHVGADGTDVVKPTPHEWLSEVAFYQVQHLVGFQGLRAFHAALVVLILWLGWRVFATAAVSGAQSATGEPRQSGPPWGLVAGAFAVWAVLTLPRLYQTRADLFSILCALLIAQWALFDPTSARGKRLVFALLAAVFWVNAHSLFLIAFALAGAAGLGALLERLETAPPGTPDDPRPREIFRGALRFVLLGVAVTALNPRGLAQHVTFFTSQSEHAIWDVVDDWFPFDPLSPSNNSPMLSPLGWLAGTATLVALLGAVVAVVRALPRLGRAEGRALLDLPGLLMAVAACAAYLISFRFMWLAFVPLRYVVRVAAALAPRPASPVGAVVAAGVAGALPTAGFWLLLMSDVPGFATPPPGRPASVADRVGAYLSTPVNHASFAGEGAQFLREAQLQGRMFNNYTLGAYLGYHLAPRIRTFIDGRTEHYSARVAADYDVIESGGVREADGRPFLLLLEDYRVDVFFGVGGPGWPYRATSTLRHLEGVPWWRLVYRSAGFAIYLRDNATNDANFARVAAYWQARGVPFDRARGLDVGAVLRLAPEWARENRLVPAGGLGDPRTAARLRFVAGDYEGAVEDVKHLLDAGAGADTALLGAEALIALGRYPEAAHVLDAAASRGADPAEVQRLRELAVATEGFRTHLPPLAAPPDPR